MVVGAGGGLFVGSRVQVHHKVLDSCRHGIPQKRERVWIVAIRTDSVIANDHHHHHHQATTTTPPPPPVTVSGESTIRVA